MNEVGLLHPAEQFERAIADDLAEHIVHSDEGVIESKFGNARNGLVDNAAISLLRSSEFAFDVETFSYIDAGANETDELRPFCKTGNAMVEKPAVLAIVTEHSILHPKFLAGFSAVAICGYCTAAVIGVDEFGPTFTGDRIDLPAGKFEPRLVYPSAIPRFIGLPDKDRRGIGDVSKTRFAFAD